MYLEIKGTEKGETQYPDLIRDIYGIMINHNVEITSVTLTAGREIISQQITSKTNDIIDAEIVEEQEGILNENIR